MLTKKELIIVDEIKEIINSKIKTIDHTLENDSYVQNDITAQRTLIVSQQNLRDILKCIDHKLRI